MKINSVLITGGTGSFGKTMVDDLLAKGVSEIRILSRDEEKQDMLRNSLRSPNVRFFIGDIRDRESVDRAVTGVDCVFHAAALKQVPSCEFFPIEAVRTNILGSENVIRASVNAGVRSVVCLSTDKAVLPVNAMGMSKAMMEKLAQAMARSLGPDAATKVSMVRERDVLARLSDPSVHRTNQIWARNYNYRTTNDTFSDAAARFRRTRASCFRKRASRGSVYTQGGGLNDFRPYKGASRTVRCA